MSWRPSPTLPRVPETDVLVIGAGMAGLTAATELERLGMRCVVLDKGRAVGGRMATRTLGAARFDHGAQHLSARTPAFAAAVEEWVAAGAARVWLRTPSRTRPDRAVEPRHAGVGGMRRIPERIAAALADVRTGVPVDRLDVAGGRAAAAGVSARAVIVTPPLPQSRALLEGSGITIEPALDRALAAVRYDACLAVMATLAGPSGLADGHAAPSAGPVAWMADNQHKGTSEVPAVTIHSTAQFAAARLEAPPEAWVGELCAAAGGLLASPVVSAVGHRWRYSMPRPTLDIGCAAVRHGKVPIILAGEAFADARVEGAYVSGRAAAAVLAYLAPGPADGQR